MGKKFIDRVIEFLNTLYNIQGPTVDTPKIKKILSDTRYKNVIPYLAIRKFIKITFKNEQSTDVGPENIRHVHLTDSGVEFLIDYKNRENQTEFNRIIAFTGAILALIGIYTFIKDLGLINNSNFWIGYIFLAFAVISIGPIISFLIKSYFSND
jgi:hypothetical protein